MAPEVFLLVTLGSMLRDGFEEESPVLINGVNMWRKFNAHRAITHGGTFHADDVFAAALLRSLYRLAHPEGASSPLPVLRANDLGEIEDLDDGNTDLVFDIGGGEFDHHQADFDQKRENGIKYSSFGLLWRAFGMALCDNDYDVWSKVDLSLVQAIDARDNGQELVLDNQAVLAYPMSVSQVIADMNPCWDQEDTPDAANGAFENAVAFAASILQNRVNVVRSAQNARRFIEKAIASSSAGIIALDKFAPWQDVVCASEKAKDCLYVVYPSNREGYCVQAIPVRKGSYDLRKPLPEDWRGLGKERLQTVSGVKDALFCHSSGFLCAAESFESAMKMAETAIQS